jgi:DNA transposition AAA+ family ATPase
MDLKTKNKVTETLVEYLESPSRSANQLAEASGVNKAYISNVRNGKFVSSAGNGKEAGIPDSVFFKIADAIGLALDNHIHWDTPNYQLIQRVCARAQVRKERMLLTGDTGLGKTYALESYARDHDKVLYIKCTRTMTGKDLLDEICKKLGMREELRGNRNKMNAIQRRVTGIPGWLLIIDEAEYLKNSMFDLVKEAADFTEGKCAMILAGMDLLLQIKSMAERNKKGFPQLYRRFRPNTVELKQITKKEVAEICKNAGITDTTAINVLKRYIYDYDMLNQYVSELIDQQQKAGRVLNGEDLIELFALTY